MSFQSVAQKGKPKTDKQRFMDHFGITEQQFDMIYKVLGEEVFKLLPERPQKVSVKSSLFQAKEWDTKYINDLPDSAFAFVVKGDKDSEGKTVPRTNRNLPHHKPNGDVDLPHLRNAMARVTHTNLTKEQQKQAHDHLLRHYRELGIAHPPCSVPGCKGYYPKEQKKSMLEDWQAFRAYSEAWLKAQGKRAVVVT